MNITTLLEEIRGSRRGVTVDDIRKVFGDYHNLLRWVAAFLVEDHEPPGACVIDACTIAEAQTAVFHEWLVHWGARATVARALQGQRAEIAELARQYEQGEPVRRKCPPLSAEYFLFLVENFEEVRDRLDVLCRFVLVLRGIAMASYEHVTNQLGISRNAIDAAYLVAFEAVERVSARQPSDEAMRLSHIKKQHGAIEASQQEN
jgi:hypothetical protein